MHSGWYRSISMKKGKQMVKWKYTLNMGRDLRKSVIAKNSSKTIQLIRFLCISLLDKLTHDDKEQYSDDLKELIELLEGEEIVIKYEPNVVIDNWGFDSLNELVDDRLEQFYDICNRCRCWIEV